MISEKTINICGREVAMRYCAAAETGYEQLSGQSSDIFVPTIEYDEDGKTVKNIIQRAKADDYIKLAMAAIVAAYARRNEETPITVDDILYDATPQEVTELIKTVIDLRAKWYEIAQVVKDEAQRESDAEDTNEDEKPKNA